MYCVALEYLDSKVTLDITLNWPNVLRCWFEKINDLNYAMKLRYALIESLLNKFTFQLKANNVLYFKSQCGLVCFRLIGSDKLNEKLLSAINASAKLHMVPASVNEKYVIRFCAVAQNATDNDIGMCEL